MALTQVIGIQLAIYIPLYYDRINSYYDRTRLPSISISSVNFDAPLMLHYVDELGGNCGMMVMVENIKWLNY